MSLARYLLRFQPLFNSGITLSFPCDAQGQVALDELDDRSRSDYLFARAVVGRALCKPIVELFSSPEESLD